MVKYSEQTLTAEQQQQAQKNIGVTWPCNPNLLDNWYFGNPVNQRGQTSYTGAVYGIDRWKGESDTTVTVADNGVTITASSIVGILQKHEKPSDVNGKWATLSILTADGSLSKLTLTIGDYADGGDVGDIRAYSTTNVMLYLRIKSGGTSVTILAVKLELGSEQTLAHQDADGNWVLNEIPDYGEQLARCQRYARIYGPESDSSRIQYFEGYIGSNTTAKFYLPWLSMRAQPVVSFAGNWHVVPATGSSTFPVTDMSVGYGSSIGIEINATFTNTTTLAAGAICKLAKNLDKTASLIISADL